jgi:hypothetical protein
MRLRISVMIVATITLFLVLTATADVCIAQSAYVQPAGTYSTYASAISPYGTGSYLGCPGCPGCPDNPVRQPGELGCWAMGCPGCPGCPDYNGTPVNPGEPGCLAYGCW